jgi:WD40 repeat protein
MTDYERLAKQPYTQGHECCTVDVHPAQELLLAGTGTSIAVRDAARGTTVATIEPGRWIRSARFSPDGSLVLVAGRDNALALFDARSGRPASAWTAPLADAACWRARHGTIVAASAGGVGELDGRTLRPLRPIANAATARRPQGVAVTPDGERLLVAADAGVTCLVAATGAPAWTREFSGCRAGHVSTSADGGWIAVAVGGTWRGIALLRTVDGAPGPYHAFQGARGVAWPHEGPAVVTPDAKAQDAMKAALASMGLDPSTVNTRAIEAPKEHLVSWEPAPAFDRQGASLAVNLPDGRLSIVDARTGAARMEFERRPGLAWIETLAWFADGRRLLVGCGDGRAAVWSLDDSRQLLEIPM